MHIMLDLETLGTEPGCVVLSIGAVVFDPQTKDVGREFYVNICPDDSTDHGLKTDPRTVEWWSQQSQEAQDALKTDRRILNEALDEFTAWLHHESGFSCEQPRIWCQGATFDAPILEAAYKALGQWAPWKFWNVRDTRTVYDLADFDHNSIEREGTYHNALDDAKHQVLCVQRALRDWKS